MPRLGPQACCQKFEQRLEGLKEKEYEIKHALMRLMKGKKAGLRRRDHSEQVALHVLCKSGGSQKLAQHFLERNLGEHSAKAVADTFAAVLATYEGMSDEEISVLREPTALGKSTALAHKAARFLKECHLAKWVETRNMEQSIAPVASLVAQEARVINCLPPDPTSTKRTSQLQWLRRWRRRWSITLGCIAAREHVPPEEARLKAYTNEDVCAGGPILVHFSSVIVVRPNRKWGPLYGPCFGSAVLNSNRGLGPFSGTQFRAPGTYFLKFRQGRSGNGVICCMLMFRHMSEP